jgi:hypothetical protein
MADYVAPVVTLLTGIGLGFYAHWLTRKRDAETRKHSAETAAATRKSNFLGFMDGWRTEIERKNIRTVANEFNDRVSEFRKEATKIRGDYSPTFWKLADSLSSLRAGEIEEGANQGDSAPGRKELLTRLDNVARYVEAN